MNSVIKKRTLTLMSLSPLRNCAVSTNQCYFQFLTARVTISVASQRAIYRDHLREFPPDLRPPSVHRGSIPARPGRESMDRNFWSFIATPLGFRYVAGLAGPPSLKAYSTQCSGQLLPGYLHQSVLDPSGNTGPMPRSVLRGSKAGFDGQCLWWVYVWQKVVGCNLR